jgi:hypothetical protein
MDDQQLSWVYVALRKADLPGWKQLPRGAADKVACGFLADWSAEHGPPGRDDIPAMTRYARVWCHRVA